MINAPRQRLTGQKRKTYDTRINPRAQKLRKLKNGIEKMEKIFKNLEDVIDIFNPALFLDIKDDPELNSTFKKMKFSNRKVRNLSRNIEMLNVGLENISKVIENLSEELENLSDGKSCSICMEITSKCNRLPRFCNCKQILCIPCAFKIENRKCPTCRFSLFQFEAAPEIIIEDVREIIIEDEEEEQEIFLID